ncbi:MAG TPA: hypothetical protein VL854_11740, partial [Nitrososphaeraceae archaeon]|nr:hypothetical protein [Nitrososphaeraceae archaeon]
LNQINLKFQIHPFLNRIAISIIQAFLCCSSWLNCYLDKDGSRIITKPTIDDIIRRLECMKEICDNSLDEKSSLEKRKKKFEAIKIKYQI